MADIILIYPKTGFDIKNVWCYLPLSTLSLASLLVKNGYNITLIDQRVDDDWKSKLKNALKKAPLFVGISSMTGSQIYYGLDIAKFIRENSSSPIVWGGVHPSLLPMQTIKNNYVDMVIRGEGEITSLELAENLEKNKGISDIKGIIFKEDSKVKINPDRGFLDLNTLPELPYHLIDVNKYLKNESVIPFSSSRGCTYNCAYCCNTTYNLGKWRAMSAEKAIEGIQYVYDKYKFERIVFFDENFFVDKKRAEKIADFIDDKSIWEVQGRIDSIRYIDFAKLRKKGMYQIQPGLESGSQRILELINKDISVSDILKYNRAFSKTGIITSYNFMMGFPTETKEDIFATMDMALRLTKENPNAEIASFFVYSPYPGTKMFDLAVKHGFKAPHDLEGWGRFSRHHLDTPWLDNKKDLLENLSFTAKFIDGKRINRLFANKSFKRIAPYILSRIYQKRWKKHDYRNRWDIKLLEFYVKRRVDIL